MHPMTAGNLQSAFGGESMAHMRYMIWADKATAEGFGNIARLFRAISFAEQAHATGHFHVMAKLGGAAMVTAGGGFGNGTTRQNLAAAIDGENHEVAEMYPSFIVVADAQSEGQAVRSFNWALAAEKIHATMYSQAKTAVDAGKDLDLGPVQICSVCGHTLEGEAPDRCPICTAAKTKYVAFA